MFQGALSNSQVAWIATDPDVEAFVKKMLQEHGGSISETLRKRVDDLLGIKPVDLNVVEESVPINPDES